LLNVDGWVKVRAMRSLTVCVLSLFFLISQRAISATNGLVSLSHYDEVSPDFLGMRSQGIEGIIHEATYPSFDRDSKYAYRQSRASQAGLLWGAYHFGNAGDGVKQADHFLEVVRAGMDSSSSNSGVLLVLDAERNDAGGAGGVFHPAGP
jgi:lysozyme